MSCFYPKCPPQESGELRLIVHLDSPGGSPQELITGTGIGWLY